MSVKLNSSTWCFGSYFGADGIVEEWWSVVATFHVRKGVARRQGLGLSILNERESVVAGVDGRTAYTRIS